MGGFGKDPIPGLRAAPAPARPKPPAETDTVRLRVLNGPCAERIFSATGSRIRIGRGDPPAVTVDIDLGECELGSPAMVSRLHAELIWIDGKLNVVDLGSRNGTWVNDRNVPVGKNGASDPAPLTVGAKIRFANLELEIIQPREAMDPL
jgi:pSer/pThr/pTyr-binding forkhead associated (FHA) protein